jgi:dual-specificity kinase
MNRSFEYNNHMCMVFPKYGLSIYEFLKRNAFQAFSMPVIQQMAKQLVTAVACALRFVSISRRGVFVRHALTRGRGAVMHHIRMIHTDLKPENLLFVDDTFRIVPVERGERREPVTPNLMVIDFGSAVLEHHYKSSIICTRHYRAPEVTLGAGWSYPADVWSIGCILVELYTGQALFQTHENLEHVAMMQRVLGPVPSIIVDTAECASLRSPRVAVSDRGCSKHGRKYFDSDARLAWPERASSEKSVKYVASLIPLVVRRPSCAVCGYGADGRCAGPDQQAARVVLRAGAAHAGLQHHDAHQRAPQHVAPVLRRGVWPLVDTDVLGS